VALPASAIAALEMHRKQQDELRRKFSQDYRADLDLIFANPDGTMLKPDSISASVSLIFKRMKILKPRETHCTCSVTPTLPSSWPPAYHCLPYPHGWATAILRRHCAFTAT
jgi:hypothetical protein